MLLDETKSKDQEIKLTENNETKNDMDTDNSTNLNEDVKAADDELSQDAYSIEDFERDLDNEEIMADAVPEKNEKSVAYEILMFIRDLAIMLIIFGLFTTFIADRTSVIGDSMEPHIHNGDLFVLNKISYRFSEPKRYDIVVFPYNHGQSNYIKRIIGLPGETIDFENGQVKINGEFLHENYGKEEILYEGNQNFPLVIPEGEYFVMGDNRNESSDSRYQDVGTIPQDDIIGKAGLRIWPLSNFGFVD